MTQTQEAPVAQTPVESNGTSTAQGQPATSVQTASGSQPNDPSAFQADYTRKYQELGEQRRALEAERQALEAERARLQQHSYPAQQYQQPQQYQQNDPVIDSLGTEAGGAVLGALNNIKLQVALQNEEILGRQKFGTEYDSHNYQFFNKFTGRTETRNRLMDARLSINPVTGEQLSWEQARASLNDPKKMEEEMRARIMADLQKKETSTPAMQNGGVPSQPVNNVKSPLDAIYLAERQMQSR